MNNVQEFQGNITDNLWAMMGDVRNAQGVERHGQSCFLYIYPTGKEAAKVSVDYIERADSPTLVDEGDGCNGPIDAVAQNVLDNYILFKQYTPDEERSIEFYDGLRAGAGWIYASIMVAKSHGCTQAMIGISSNDGNLYMQAWDRKTSACVEAVHNTYYGT